MRHIKRLFESFDITEKEILDNFIYITDKFGEPFVSTSDYGKLKKWHIHWDIQMNISNLQEAEKFISKLKDLMEDIEDILSAQDRLKIFNINVALRNRNLYLELVPKDVGASDYKFILKHDGRILYIKINEIERFLNSKGDRILKYEEDVDVNELYIYADKGYAKDLDELCKLINIEINQINISDEYNCYSGHKYIVISSDWEKSHIFVINK